MAQSTLQTKEIPQDTGYGSAQSASITTSLRLRIFALFVNLLVLSELCIAMYFAAQDMDNLTPVFFKVFFTLLIPTIIGTILVRRFIAARTAGR